jgi:hypothetical protein
MAQQARARPLVLGATVARDGGAEGDAAARAAPGQQRVLQPTPPVTASPPLTSAEAAYEEENIRRRVYDALNVLGSTGLIARVDKKHVVWRGLSGFLEVTHAAAAGAAAPPPPDPHPAAAPPAPSSTLRKAALLTSTGGVHRGSRLVRGRSVPLAGK